MARTRTFSGSQTAVNTNTVLTAQGSISSANNIIPGSGKNRIIAIYVSVGADFLGLGNAVYFIRVGGDGVSQGEQQIMVGAGGGQIVTTAQSAIFPFELGNGLPDNTYGNVDIECDGGGIVTVALEMAESDIGSIGAAVTLVFEHD